MKRTGMHHLGLVTLDIERTIDFYTKKLGWKVAWCDLVHPPKGGQIKHVFLDTGDGSYVAFMCPDKVPDVPTEFATDINSPQKLPGFFYHFAFWVDTLEELEEKRAALTRAGVEVTSIVNHEWCKSIYFRDPNGLLLEYCVTVRELGDDDKLMREHPATEMFESDEDRQRSFPLMTGRAQLSSAK
ncbi:MAG: VOC family protein [Candidatus Binataceae bacterium]